MTSNAWSWNSWGFLAREPSSLHNQTPFKCSRKFRPGNPLKHRRALGKSDGWQRYLHLLVSLWASLASWDIGLLTFSNSKKILLQMIDVNIRCTRSLKFGWNNCTKSRSKYFREAVLGWLECKEDGGVSKHEQWSHDSAAGPSNPPLISGSRSNDWFVNVQQ